MTTRSEREHFFRELKVSLLGRVASRAMTTRKSGLDGLAKAMVQKLAGGPLPPDSELEHPVDWDRPIE